MGHETHILRRVIEKVIENFVESSDVFIHVGSSAVNTLRRAPWWVSGVAREGKDEKTAQRRWLGIY
jgi:hypothetical protein